jgi:outer membrane autotransporter protein
MTNTGTITATNGVGVALAGSGTFTNDGPITATSTGVQVDADAAVTNRNAITSSAAEGVRIDGAGSLSNQGTISGDTNAVLVTAGGSVTNSGSLTAETGAAVSFTGPEANTFTHSGSATTNGGGAAVEMGGGADLVVLRTGATLSSDIDGGDGDDTLRLEGSGTLDQGLLSVENLVVDATDWTLPQDLPSIGDTQLVAGTLRVGAMLPGTLSVSAGATLLGSGSVGDVTSSGRVAPGDSIGTLNADSYVQSSSGELAVEVSSASADLLAVSGSADIQGGDLVLTPVGSITNAGPFDIVTAGTLTSGEFDAIVASPLLTPDVQYTPGAAGRITLTLTLTDDFASAAGTPNQAAVATAVDQVFPTATGDLADVLGGLLVLPDTPSLQEGYDQLSPEPLGATALVAFTNARWHATMLADHLRDLRLGLPTRGLRGALLPGLVSAAALPAAASLTGAREVGAWSLRANAYGVYQQLDDGSGHEGHDAASGAFGLGIDGWVTENAVLGVDLSGGYTRIESDRDDTHIDGVNGRLSAFGSFDRGPVYVDALGSYAYHWFDGTRRIRYDGIDRDAKSDHGAHEASAYLAGGVEFERGGFEFGPEAAGQYTILFEESYSEGSAGAAGLRIDDRDTDSLSTRVGARVSRPWRIDRDTTIVPRLRVAWAHEWLDTSHDLDASFVSPVPNDFTVSSRKVSRDSVLARVGLQALLGDDIVVEADYGVDIGSGESMSHQLGVILRAAF